MPSRTPTRSSPSVQNKYLFSADLVPRINSFHLREDFHPHLFPFFSFFLYCSRQLHQGQINFYFMEDKVLKAYLYNIISRSFWAWSLF